MTKWKTRAVDLGITGGVIALLIWVLTCSGCSTTPRQNFSIVNDAFITVVVELNAARDAGKITEEDWQETVLPKINLGNDLVNLYDEATKNGGGDGFTLAELGVLIGQLRELIPEG